MVVVEVVLNMTDTIDIIQQVVPNQDQELVVVQDVMIIIINHQNNNNNNDMIELDLDLNHVIVQVVVEKINIIIIIHHLMIVKVKMK